VKNRAAQLKSILVLVQRAGAERHVLGEEIAQAQELGESVFTTDEELALIAEINGRLTAELSVYAGMMTVLIGDPEHIDALPPEKQAILFVAQQRGGECVCHPCRVQRAAGVGNQRVKPS
jgi:hypothetical protein